MNLAEIKAAQQRANEIEHWLRKLDDANEKLRLVNRFVKEGSVWRPSLCIKKSDGGYGSSIDISIPISGGLIQQTAINEVVAIRRELNILGYEWPAGGKS